MVVEGRWALGTDNRPRGRTVTWKDSKAHGEAAKQTVVVWDIIWASSLLSESWVNAKDKEKVR